MVTKPQLPRTHLPKDWQDGVFTSMCVIIGIGNTCQSLC